MRITKKKVRYEQKFSGNYFTECVSLREKYLLIINTLLKNIKTKKANKLITNSNKE